MSKYTPVDMQKAKLEKLMQNIDKPIEIPQRSKTNNFASPPEFVRNIMGSSAGAGSGEFHVYRHLRRKEYARQRFIEEQAKREELDRKYKERLEEKKRLCEEKSAKKRAKRLKKKEKMKQIKKKKVAQDQHCTESSDGDEEEEANEKQEKTNTDIKKEDLKQDENSSDSDIGPLPQ